MLSAVGGRKIFIFIEDNRSLFNPTPDQKKAVMMMTMHTQMQGNCFFREILRAKMDFCLLFF